MDLVSSTDCPRFVPENFKMWLRGLATNIICSCGGPQRDASGAMSAASKVTV
jgi:hypothetical protein